MRNTRRWAGIAVGVAGLLCALVPATSAQASSTACPATVKIANVHIHSTYQYVTPILDRSCGATEATWSVYNSAGEDNYLDFDPAKPGATAYGGARYDFYEYSYYRAPTGTYTVQPAGAWNAQYTDVPQATTRFFVRFSSLDRLSGYRRGSYVYLHAYTLRWSPNGNKGRGGWIAATGQLDSFGYRYRGGTVWHHAASGYPRSNGYTLYKKVYAPSRRWWHVSIPAVSYAWGSTSASLYL